jgi:hypothetical protein
LRLLKNLAGCDQQHLVTYLRLPDADAEGADWQELALTLSIPQPGVVSFTE